MTEFPGSNRLIPPTDLPSAIRTGRVKSFTPPPSPDDVRGLENVADLFSAGLRACIDDYQGGIGFERARELVALAKRAGVDFPVQQILDRGEIGWQLGSL